MSRLFLLGFFGLACIVAGCGRQSSRGTAGGTAAVDLSAVEHSIATMYSDPEKVRSAEYSMLFVGNSHTTYHDLPHLVARMIEHGHPGKKAFAHILPVMFLEQTADDSRLLEEVDRRQWKYVILQAQKISMSGKYKYSQKEGIALAKRAKGHGAQVLFYSEWGRKGVAGDGVVQEKIYREMATAAGVRVCPIGQGWDLALSQRPEMALHDVDGNHQSALGAYLTACVLYGFITGKSPASLAAYPYAQASEADRQFLAKTAATIFEREMTKQKK